MRAYNSASGSISEENKLQAPNFAAGSTFSCQADRISVVAKLSKTLTRPAWVR
jgi:hypothetical protein